MRANKTRIVLADSQKMFVEALRLALQQDSDLEVVGTASDSDEVYFLSMRHAPDVVIMEVDMSGRGAFTAAEEIMSRFPATKIVFLTGYLSDIMLDQALRMRAAGFLLKEDSLDKLRSDLKLVLRGEHVYSTDVFERMEFDALEGRFQVKSQSFLAGLTSRQLEVLRHLVRGESVKEVARVMVLSERAIESHKYRIMQKLGIHDRVELSRFAIREGLTSP